MPGQRRHLADIDHELERNFLNLSELKSNKRRRSENKNSSIGNMVKTMAVIPTHRRRPSGAKTASSSRSKTTRSTVSLTTGRKRCISPGLDSSTAYDTSTSPTYYTSSTVASGSRAKQRKCSPLPAWLANTFSGLVRNHPLRLLLPGNPSPPASPSPVVCRRPSLPPPPAQEISHRTSRRPSPSPPKQGHRPRKKGRTKESRIFAFDPFEPAEDEPVPPPEQETFETAAPDYARQATDTFENYTAQMGSLQDDWSHSVEQYPEERDVHDDYNPTPPLEPTYPVMQELLPDYYAPPGIATSALTDPFPNYQLDECAPDFASKSPPSWRHSALSVPRRCDSPVDEPGLPGSQYVSQLYKMRGPASTIEVSAPMSKPFYFSSPTEDSFSSPSYAMGVSTLAPQYEEAIPVPVTSMPVIHEPRFPATRQALPLITPIAKPPASDGPFEFSWKKFDRNGILAQAPSGTTKPIYKLPPSDDDDYSEISNVLPSLLLGTGNVTRKAGLSNSDQRREEEVWNPYENPASNVAYSNVSCGQGPRFVRASQSSSQAKSGRVQQDPATMAPHQPKTPVAGTQAPPSTPIRRGCQVTVQVVGTPIEWEEDDNMEMTKGVEENVEVETPKSSAIFAPAPGIYISPLRGSETSNDTKEKTAARPDSQVSNDSIQSWFG